MNTILKVVEFFIGLLTPPADFDWDTLHRWCVNTSITLGIIVMATGAFVAIAFGAVPIFGFAGFAAAGEVQDTQRQVLAMRVEGLQEQTLTFQEKKCDARTAGNKPAERLYDRLILERQQKHRALMDGHPVEVPPCES